MWESSITDGIATGIEWRRRKTLVFLCTVVFIGDKEIEKRRLVIFVSEMSVNCPPGGATSVRPHLVRNVAKQQLYRRHKTQYTAQQQSTHQIKEPVMADRSISRSPKIDQWPDTEPESRFIEQMAVYTLQLRVPYVSMRSWKSITSSCRKS